MTRKKTRASRAKKLQTEEVVEQIATTEEPMQAETPPVEVVKEVIIDAAIDERLNAAIAASNYRITLNNQRQNARLALQKGLTYAVNGGVFNIDATLISLVQSLISMDKESAILLDVNQNPVEIENLQDFQESIVEIYYEKMNEFLAEFKSIQKSRTAKALIGE